MTYQTIINKLKNDLWLKKSNNIIRNTNIIAYNTRIYHLIYLIGLAKINAIKINIKLTKLEPALDAKDAKSALIKIKNLPKLKTESEKEVKGYTTKLGKLRKRRQHIKGIGNQIRINKQINDLKYAHNQLLETQNNIKHLKDLLNTKTFDEAINKISGRKSNSEQRHKINIIDDDLPF